MFGGGILNKLRSGGTHAANMIGALQGTAGAVREAIQGAAGGAGAKYKAIQALVNGTTPAGRYLKSIGTGASLGAGIGAAAGVAKGGYDYFNGSGTMGGIVSNGVMGGIYGGIAGGAFRALRPKIGGTAGFINANSPVNGLVNGTLGERLAGKIASW